MDGFFRIAALIYTTSIVLRVSWFETAATWLNLTEPTARSHAKRILSKTGI
jgi:hypothetical protein